MSLDRSTANGLVINELRPGAISELGLRKGDRIYTVNGVDVDDETEFLSALFDPRVREGEASLIVYRNARPKTIRVDPQVLLNEFTAARSSPLASWGLALNEHYTGHAVVERVDPDSPAFRAGFRPGDVITTFQETPVTSRQEFVRLAGQAPGGLLSFGVLRGGQNQQLDLPLAGAATGLAGTTTDAAAAQQFGNSPDAAFQPDVNAASDSAVSPAATAQQGTASGTATTTGTTATPTAVLQPQNTLPRTAPARTTTSGPTRGGFVGGRTTSGGLFPTNAPSGIGTGRSVNARGSGVIPSGSAGTMVPGAPTGGATSPASAATQSTQVPGVISGSSRTPLGTGGGGIVSPPRP
jgi:membrane-associated protease RseP (regulator of RpoE activity)